MSGQMMSRHPGSPLPGSPLRSRLLVSQGARCRSSGGGIAAHGPDRAVADERSQTSKASVAAPGREDDDPGPDPPTGAINDGSEAPEPTRCRCGGSPQLIEGRDLLAEGPGAVQLSGCRFGLAPSHATQSDWPAVPSESAPEAGESESTGRTFPKESNSRPRRERKARISC